MKRLRPLSPRYRRAVLMTLGMVRVEAGAETHAIRKCALAICESILSVFIEKGSVMPTKPSKDHTIAGDGQCVHWCHACQHNRGLGLNPDGTEVTP